MVTSLRPAPLRSGFTIIEILTAIGIFAILTTLVVANFRNGGLNDDLRFSAEQLVGNLRRAQNLSTTGQTILYGGQNIVPPGGYGIAVVWIPQPTGVDENGDFVYGPSAEYAMFADVQTHPTENGKVPHEEGDGHPCDPGPDEEFVEGCDVKVEAGRVVLRPSVVITKLSLQGWTGGSIGFDAVDIAFQPPHPKPLIEGYSGTVRIELFHRKIKKCRTVTVNAVSGQVSERSGSIDRGTLRNGQYLYDQCYDPFS